MLLKYCDFSYGKPNWVQLKAAGFSVAAGYLSDTPGKGMSAQDIKDCCAAGLYFLGLYETTANAAMGGRAEGVKQATAATSIAKRVGYTGKLIEYAIDFNATTTQMATVAKFVEGLHDVQGLDGEYGGINQLRYLISHGVTDKEFQTYAWSNGQWLPLTEAPIRQTLNGQKIAGGTVDIGWIDDSILPLLMAPTNVEEIVTPAEFLAILKDPGVAAEVKALAAQGVFSFDPGTIVNGAPVANGGILVPDYQPDSVASGGTNPTAGLGWAVSELLRNVHAAQVALASVLTAIGALPSAIPATTATCDPAAIQAAIEALTWKAVSA